MATGEEVEGIAQIQGHRCGPDAGTHVFMACLEREPAQGMDVLALE